MLRWSAPSHRRGITRAGRIPLEDTAQPPDVGAGSGPEHETKLDAGLPPARSGRPAPPARLLAGKSFPWASTSGMPSSSSKYRRCSARGGEQHSPEQVAGNRPKRPINSDGRMLQRPPADEVFLPRRRFVRA
jgi:hypothetical protein